MVCHGDMAYEGGPCHMICGGIICSIWYGHGCDGRPGGRPSHLRLASLGSVSRFQLLVGFDTTFFSAEGRIRRQRFASSFPTLSSQGSPLGMVSLHPALEAIRVSTSPAPTFTGATAALAPSGRPQPARVGTGGHLCVDVPGRLRRRSSTRQTLGVL